MKGGDERWISEAGESTTLTVVAGVYPEAEVAPAGVCVFVAVTVTAVSQKHTPVQWAPSQVLRVTRHPTIPGVAFPVLFLAPDGGSR
jgi:hypothetical protein